MTKEKWLALARESLIRAGLTPSQADEVINDLTGDCRDTVNERDWAFETINQVFVDVVNL